MDVYFQVTGNLRGGKYYEKEFDNKRKGKKWKIEREKKKIKLIVKNSSSIILVSPKGLFWNNKGNFE